MKDPYSIEIDFTDQILAYDGENVKRKKDGSPVKKQKKRATEKGEFRDKNGDLKKTSADEKAGYPPNCNEGYEAKDGKCVPIKKDEANLQMGYPKKQPMAQSKENPFKKKGDDKKKGDEKKGDKKKGDKKKDGDKEKGDSDKKKPFWMKSGAQSQTEFVADCMCNDSLVKEFSHQEQRHAVCYSKWRQAKKKAEGAHICWNDEAEDYFSYIIY